MESEALGYRDIAGVTHSPAHITVPLPRSRSVSAFTLGTVLGCCVCWNRILLDQLSAFEKQILMF